MRRTPHKNKHRPRTNRAKEDSLRTFLRAYAPFVWPLIRHTPSVMLRPENTHPQDQDANLRDNDILESTEGAGFGRVSDSATSADDAGLPDLDDDANFNDDEGPLEISMTDALSGSDRPELHSPEMSDLDAPGEIDMEELDDFTVEEALPDARLDPLEP